MKNTAQIMSARIACFSIPLLPMLFLISACSSDSATTGTVSTTTPAPLGSSVKNVPLSAGVPSQVRFTYTVPGDISSTGNYSADLTQTLRNVTLSATPVADKGSRFETLRLLAYAMVKQAFAAETAQVTAYISFAGDPNVCTSPYVFGPFSIIGAIGEAVTSDTTTVAPSQAAVDIINAGSFEVCLVTTPPIDAFLTVTGVAMNIEDCAPPTVDILGSWSGPFSCDNTGIPDAPENPGDPLPTVNLTITQNPDGSYHYNDGVADYDGNLCGNVFRFNGGASGDYNESGTMIVNGNTATKTSNWQDATNPFFIYGRCSDNLNRS